MGPGGTEEILLVHRRKHYLLYISCCEYICFFRSGLLYLILLSFSETSEVYSLLRARTTFGDSSWRYWENYTI